MLFADALDELLNTARLATIATWIVRAETKHLSSSTIQVARAEIALRDGKHLRAQTLAQEAITMAGERRAATCRAAMTAGRAAHAGSREESALEFYRLAKETAETLAMKQEALWGELMCASALELSDAHELLELLEISSSSSDAYKLVRMADKKLGMDFRFGAIRHLADARRVEELVGHVADPFVRCSFRCALSCALNLSSLYSEGLKQASLLLNDATEYRIDLALPYAYSMRAAALAGTGHYRAAHDALDAASRESQRCHDEFGIQSVYASRMRILVQQGLAHEACAIEPPDLQNALRSIRGEVLTSRGLALASSGRLEEADDLRSDALAITNGVETRVLAAAIDAVCAINGRRQGRMDAVERLAETGYNAGAVDLVVAAYRGNPDLLAALLSSARAREQSLFIVARAGDHALASAIGLDDSMRSGPVETLSRREREVYELLCDGLTNREIAKRLFISEGTVKVHAHHVYDKLGVRSRTALAMNAARDRWRQAAPRTSTGDDGALASSSAGTTGTSASSG